MELVNGDVLATLEGGTSWWIASVAGLTAAGSCLMGGGAAFGPAGWVGCGAAGLLTGVGTYIL